MCRTLARRFFGTFFGNPRKWLVLDPGPCLGPRPQSCTPAPHQRSQETNRNQRQSQKESRIPNMFCTLAPIFLERSSGQVLEMVSLGPWPVSWAPPIQNARNHREIKGCAQIQVEIIPAGLAASRLRPPKSCCISPPARLWLQETMIG